MHNFNYDSSDGWVNGRIGRALKFDGSNDYVSLSSSLTNGLSSFSVALWIKTSETGTCANYWECPCVMGVGTGGFASNDFSILTDSGNLSWYSGLGASGDNQEVLGKTVSDGEWHFIVVSNDGSNLDLYFDSEKVSSFSSDGSGLDSQPFYIGANNNGGSPNYYHEGTIDEPMVFSRALNAAEVYELYKTQHVRDDVNVFVSTYCEDGGSVGMAWMIRILQLFSCSMMAMDCIL